MADLSAMYMDLAENVGNAPYQGALRMQQFMENQLAYQKAREDMEAQRGLRALFEQNPNATPEEVSRFNPQLGMQMQQSEFKRMLDMGQMEKLNREKEEYEAKVYAQHLSGPTQDYFDDIKKGMNEQQAEYKFRTNVGKAQAEIDQRFGIKPKVDFTQYSPLQIANRIHSLGVDIPYLKELEERNLSQVPPKMTATQAYGDVKMGQYGPMIQPPLPRQPRGTGMGGAPAAQLPEGYERATAEDIPAIQQAYDNATDLNEKQQIGALLNQLKQQAQPAGSQFVTPQQESQLRIKEKQQEADIQTKALEERKATELDVEKKAAKQKAIEAFGLVPSLKEVEDLIAGSTSGKRQVQAATMFQDVTGKSTPGMENIGTLSVIAGRLRDAVNRAPGSQSDKDAIIESLKTGDIANPEIGANQRVKAYKEFVRQMREMIKKETGIDAGSVDGIADNQTPVTVKSRAEVQALPKGTLFMGSDGVVHRRK